MTQTATALSQFNIALEFSDKDLASLATALVEILDDL